MCGCGIILYHSPGSLELYVERGVRAMSFFDKFKSENDPYKMEIEAEITMLQHVLSSAGVHICNHEHLNRTGFRTFLISQMKYVIPIIDELQKIRTEFTSELDIEIEKRKGVESRLHALQIKENEYSKMYDDELKALREENRELKKRLNEGQMLRTLKQYEKDDRKHITKINTLEYMLHRTRDDCQELCEENEELKTELKIYKDFVTSIMGIWNEPI